MFISTTDLIFVAKESVRSLRSYCFEFEFLVIRICFGFRISDLNLLVINLYTLKLIKIDNSIKPFQQVMVMSDCKQCGSVVGYGAE